VRTQDRLPELCLGVFVVVLLFCLIGPGYSWWGARVEPLVLGLPFSLAWHVAWVIASCLALFLYHRAVRSRRSR
jgi:hypothetical protein